MDQEWSRGAHVAGVSLHPLPALPGPLEQALREESRVRSLTVVEKLLVIPCLSFPAWKILAHV